MKFLSAFIGFLVALLALLFALNNRQNAAINLWPLDIEIQAPLFLLTLGTLFLGLLMGSLLTWFKTLSHRFEVRRLRKEVLMLKEKMAHREQTILLPPAMKPLPDKNSQRPFWKFR